MQALLAAPGDGLKGQPSGSPKGRKLAGGLALGVRCATVGWEEARWSGRGE